MTPDSTRARNLHDLWPYGTTRRLVLQCTQRHHPAAAVRHTWRLSLSLWRCARKSSRLQSLIVFILSCLAVCTHPRPYLFTEQGIVVRQAKRERLKGWQKSVGNFCHRDPECYLKSITRDEISCFFHLSFDSCWQTLDFTFITRVPFITAQIILATSMSLFFCFSISLLFKPSFESWSQTQTQ